MHLEQIENEIEQLMTDARVKGNGDPTMVPKQVRQAFSAGFKSAITLVLDTCSVSVLDKGLATSTRCRSASGSATSAWGTGRRTPQQELKSHED